MLKEIRAGVNLSVSAIICIIITPGFNFYTILFSIGGHKKPRRIIARFFMNANWLNWLFCFKLFD